MCESGQWQPVPATVPAKQHAPGRAAEAAGLVQRGLRWLARVDAAGLTTVEQADCLRALEQAESMLTAARAQVLAAFRARSGYEDDGQGSAGSWLRWQTKVTRGAAAEAVGWMRRLAAHPSFAQALAAGQLSASWARAVCGWTDKLPEQAREGADQILVDAALAGAELADLTRLAEEIRARTATPDPDDGDDGFADRRVQLDLTYRGAGKLTGDLTPGCAAALEAVLAALGQRAGPEDLRTTWQRDHDALEEACRRLIAAGGLPGRAAHPDPASYDFGSSARPARCGRRAGGLDAGLVARRGPGRRL